MLSQQVLRAGIMDVLGIINITDIINIADIVNIWILWWRQVGMYKVLLGYPIIEYS